MTLVCHICVLTPHPNYSLQLNSADDASHGHQCHASGGCQQPTISSQSRVQLRMNLSTYLLPWPVQNGSLQLQQRAANLVADGRTPLLVVYSDWGGGSPASATGSAGEETTLAAGANSGSSARTATKEPTTRRGAGGGGGVAGAVGEKRHVDGIVKFECCVSCLGKVYGSIGVDLASASGKIVIFVEFTIGEFDIGPKGGHLKYTFDRSS